MIKRFKILFLATAFYLLSNQLFAEKLVVAGPFASVSHPIMHMIKTNALKDLGKEIEFRLWKNPDELRALVLNSDVKFIAVPTNVAANLYNKNIDIKLLNVSVWGILGMVSRNQDLKTLSDFKDKEIVVPFRADMPDIVFQELIKKRGLDPKKDFKLKYVSSPIDAMQMLVLRQVDHALLAEPAISIALRKTGSFPIKLIAPDLYRSVDLQEEWGKLFKTEAKVPQAGMAFLGKTEGNEELINRFMTEYEKSLNWYKSNPKEAAQLVVKTLPMLEAEGLADSIEHVNLNSVNAIDSKKDLEFFYDILKNSNPKLIGGKLPSQGLYYE
ncbi:ABC transporter substrate-binding protein [Arcobacter sp. LA11]|uniref:ABC transporter substrate-binding protein n=1 Tax=Arcobacter sp. LA11 TaxID=1898176 RepID=UPI00093415EF|nr:ABC transporter substrate-binding protein [Arcobacter sp. LA11]